MGWLTSGWIGPRVQLASNCTESCGADHPQAVSQLEGKYKMSKGDEWYVNARWDPDEQEMFFRRVNRARYKMPYILRVKASNLWRSRDPFLAQEALKLYEKVIEEFPRDPRITTCLREMGQCYEFLGDIDAAIDAYLKTLEYEEREETNITTAWSDLSLLVIRTGKTDLFDEVLNLIDNRPLHLEYQRFIIYSVRAIIAYRRNQLNEAKVEANNALEVVNIQDSGLRYRPKLGLVDPDKYLNILEELNTICSS
jgi:tetratricopeptide (TPR) repeat protein